MSRYLLIGTTGSNDLTLIDLVERTVETIPADGVDPEVTKFRQDGATLIKGVDVAIAVDDRQDAVGRFLFDGGQVR